MLLLLLLFVVNVPDLGLNTEMNFALFWFSLTLDVFLLFFGFVAFMER